MSGYTVFLGPITGIMITDVSLHVPFIHPCLSQISRLIGALISLARTPHTRRCSLNVSTSWEV